MATGWPAVRDKCLTVGITFDPWQDGAGRAILGKRADGLYAADAIVLSIPRQVGKTFLIGSIIFALAMMTPNTTAIWTAHRFPTACETFDQLAGMARTAAMRPHVRKILSGTNDKAIYFRNGSRILFGARERGFGRGFAKVDVLVLDEAQTLSENAMADMVPATNQSANPLVFLMGTPPKPSDTGEVFTLLRQEAIDGESDTTFYLEFSADEGCDPMDRAQWAKANPSYPHRTSARAILRMKKLLGNIDGFKREALGIWDGTATVGVFTHGTWGRRAVDTDPPKVAALGIASDLDQVWLSLAAAGGADPTYIGAAHRCRVDIGREELVAEVKRMQDEYGVPVAIDAKGPASFLIPDLEAAGVWLARASMEDFVQACADLHDAIETGTAVHGRHDELDEAVDASGWRKIGERRVFARKEGDISMLEAAALAVWAINFPPPEVSVHGFDDLDMCDQCGAEPHDDPDGEHDYLCPDCREAAHV